MTCFHRICVRCQSHRNFILSFNRHSSLINIQSHTSPISMSMYMHRLSSSCDIYTCSLQDWAALLLSFCWKSLCLWIRLKNERLIASSKSHLVCAWEIDAHHCYPLASSYLAVPRIQTDSRAKQLRGWAYIQVRGPEPPKKKNFAYRMLIGRYSGSASFYWYERTGTEAPMFLPSRVYWFNASKFTTIAPQECWKIGSTPPLCKRGRRSVIIKYR